MANDTFTIEILPDGTIKTLTDAVSGANHANAEEFLRFVARQCGGETTRTRRSDVNVSLKAAFHEHTADGHHH